MLQNPIVSPRPASKTSFVDVSALYQSSRKQECYLDFTPSNRNRFGFVASWGREQGTNKLTDGPTKRNRSLEINPSLCRHDSRSDFVHHDNCLLRHIDGFHIVE